MRNLNDIRQIQGRSRILMLLISGCLVISVFGFWFVQIVRGVHYREMSENNQYRENRIPAPRGKILDRTGEVILVNNRPSFNIYIIPERSENIVEDLKKVQELLQLQEREIKDIRDKAARRLSFQPVLIKEDIPFDIMAYFEARRDGYPWITIVVDQKRFYPFKSMAAHSLGRVGEVSERQLKQKKFKGLYPGAMAGQSGLEYGYQHILAGKDGNFVEVRNSRGRFVKEVSRDNPQTGKDLILTLDYELQKKAEELFSDKAGTLVALDVRNGEVLALVSSPTFDLNLYKEQFRALINDEDSPLLNRAISSTFSPGSVWKGLMATAGLYEGLVTPDQKVFCGGSVFLANRHWHCNGVHDWVDVRMALTRSCNTYFYKLGNRLKIDKINKWASRFGFGQRTGIDLPHEKSGLLPDPTWMERVGKRPWYPADTISVSIGQGSLLVTPLQLAVYMAAIANGGFIVQPHLIKGVVEDDGEVTMELQPPRTPLGINSEVFETVRDGLWGVVNNGGTAPRARIPQISIAGKTGTAQVVAKRYWRDDMPEELRHHVWFVCFAPYENPEVAVTVFVEHGMNSSRVAVPVAAEFLKTYAQVRNRLNQKASRRVTQ